MNQDWAFKIIRRELRESARVLTEVADSHVAVIAKIAEIVARCLKSGGTVYTCGNGGSAADAQHIAAELSGRFYLDRPALAAVALTVNTSALTAIANDYDYSQVYARQLEGLGKPGDVLLAISTSGGSKNIIQAAAAARGRGILVLGMTGAKGESFAGTCDVALVVPSDDVARIQESHIAAGHLICQLVEATLFEGNR